TSTTTNAAACANKGAASFLRSTVTTGGIRSSPGSGTSSLSRTYRSCSHHGRTGGLRWITVGAVAGLYVVAACGVVRSAGVVVAGDTAAGVTAVGDTAAGDTAAGDIGA